MALARPGPCASRVPSFTSNHPLKSVNYTAVMTSYRITIDTMRTALEFRVDPCKEVPPTQREGKDPRIGSTRPPPRIQGGLFLLQ